ncbi:endo-1,4-beta-xylanase [Rhodococcus sp. NPDC056516]|uniref:endo-1,4-beta-xylanase n=1 Tax=Rhodococcus sp. NPDC056516 TaxID=3345847 RepID=UPI00366B34B6
MTGHESIEEPDRFRIDTLGAELYRVIIDQYEENGHVTYRAFMLTNEDKEDSNRSSFVQGKITDPLTAYTNRSDTIRRRKEAEGKDFVPPYGTVGFTVEEIERVGAELGIEDTPPVLTAWDDAHMADRPDDHAHVDYSLVANSKGQVRNVAKQLADQAKENGWKFVPRDADPRT